MKNKNKEIFALYLLYFLNFLNIFIFDYIENAKRIKIIN